MNDEEECDPNIFDLQGINQIKKRPDILERIKWEVTPQMVMEPRFQQDPEALRKLREISGYMFYVESQCEPPALMLLKVGKTDITSTVGKINEVPPELLREAMENPVQKPVNGMYAVTDEIREWLKKQLGI